MPGEMRISISMDAPYETTCREASSQRLERATEIAGAFLLVGLQIELKQVSDEAGDAPRSACRATVYLLYIITSSENVSGMACPCQPRLRTGDPETEAIRVLEIYMLLLSAVEAARQSVSPSDLQCPTMCPQALD